MNVREDIPPGGYIGEAMLDRPRRRRGPRRMTRRPLVQFLTWWSRQRAAYIKLTAPGLRLSTECPDAERALYRLVRRAYIAGRRSAR